MSDEPPEPQYETCPACDGQGLMQGDGSGWDGASYHSPGCAHCQGTGAVAVAPTIRLCDACGRESYCAVWDGTPCSVCRAGHFHDPPPSRRDGYKYTAEGRNYLATLSDAPIPAGIEPPDDAPAILNGVAFDVIVTREVRSDPTSTWHVEVRIAGDVIGSGSGSSYEAGLLSAAAAMTTWVERNEETP